MAVMTLSLEAFAQQRNFVACPMVRDTQTVPCFLAEYDGETYYLGIQQDITAGATRRGAIIGATVRRCRPIALTAAAAVLAMIPLLRSDFFGPMATAMMGGLVMATVLTLVFLPALYALWFRVRD